MSIIATGFAILCAAVATATLIACAIAAIADTIASRRDNR